MFQKSLLVLYAVLASLWMSVSALAQQTSPLTETSLVTIESTSQQNQELLPQFELTESADLPQNIRDLLKDNVTIFNRPAEKINPAELRLLRFAVRRQIADILATEGYFSPSIKFENAFATSAQNAVQQVVVRINIKVGPLTKVNNVQLSFLGDAVPLALQQSVRSNWGLPQDAIFRDADWSQAKTQAIEALVEHGYAAAKMSSTEAVVQDQRADLFIVIDSGPVFRIGDLTIKGLNLYGPWLVERYHPPAKGDVYNQTKLISFQRALQNSPYFSSVTVSIDPDPALASAVPVNVLVQERKKYEVGLGAGYSTNTGARGEISFQDRDFIGDGYHLKSALRIEQLRQIGYADIFLPPKPNGYLDSFGVLFDRSDIKGLLTQTSSFGAKRTITESNVEKRLGLSFVYEQSQVDDSEKMYTKALVASIGRTWRKVDNAFDPTDGQVTQLDISAATRAALSDQDFVRLYGKHQRWIPVDLNSGRDVIILRAEAGYVIAPDDAGIPESFLFRAGGTTSVRGYAYQSLGVQQDGSVLGGRVLATASAEYVHWLKNNWGVAGFVDVGDAADRFADFKIKQGVGVGLRYKTIAGPLAFDVAYGRQAKQLRFDFFIGIAF